MRGPAAGGGAWIAGVIVVIAAAAAMAANAAACKSACYDEPKHLYTGWHLLRHGRFIGDDNTPIVALHALPLFRHDGKGTTHGGDPPAGRELFGAGVDLLTAGDPQAVLFGPRLVGVGWLVALLALVAVAGWRLGGGSGAFLATALLAFDPTILAHGSIVSADLPLAAAAVLAWLVQRRFLDQPTRWRSAALGLGLGVLLLAKYTGAVLAAVLVAHAGGQLVRSPERGRIARGMALAGGIALLLVVIAYPGDPLGYLHGLRHVSSFAGRDVPQFFHGSVGPSPWFYPAVLAFKATPAMAILSLAGLAAGLHALRRGRSIDGLLLALAATAFLTPVASGYQQGIRFLLPVFPCLALIAATLPGHMPTRAKPRRLAWTALIALLVVHAAGALRLHPDHLAYFNALAGGTDPGDRWFIDSNRDWGQDVTTLRDFLAGEHADRVYAALYASVPPAAYGLTYEDLHGDWSKLARPQGNRVALAISDTVYRYALARPNDPLHPLTTALSAIPHDARPGQTIRVWWMDPARIADLMARRTQAAGR